MESNLAETGDLIENDMSGPIVKAVQIPRAASLNVMQIESLTAREREILELLSRGLSYKMAAAELNLAMGTIQTYIGRIYKKLHVHCRLEAVLKYVAASGLSPNTFLQD
jgi:DNA-binding NarL/FixJ family response regulator